MFKKDPDDLMVLNPVLFWVGAFGSQWGLQVQVPLSQSIYVAIKIFFLLFEIAFGKVHMMAHDACDASITDD